MPQTAFDHGGLPAEVASALRCPASAQPGHPSWPAALVESVDGSGYRAKFRCSACRFEFTVSVARRRSQERIQREHELNRALEAVRTLQERLELLGDRAGDVVVVRSLRDSLARDMAELGTVVVEGPRIVLAADDVDDEGRPNEWNAAAMAEAAERATRP